MWLGYFIKINRIFCFTCKLFSKDSLTPLVNTGFSDWRHCWDYLNKHENTQKQVNSSYKIKTRQEKKMN